VPGSVFADEAADAYDALAEDAHSSEFLDRLDALLEDLRRDPSDVRFRRTRFQRPPCFRIPFIGPGGDGDPWCLLWMPEGPDILILYVGSDRFR
jgi:hypothetical protein